MTKTVLLLLLGATAAFALTPAEQAKVKEAAREYIKERLKAPATARFSKEALCAHTGRAEFDEAQGIGPAPECKPVMLVPVKDAVIYRGSVDAQNSFGALIRTKYHLAIQPDPKTGELTTIDIDAIVKTLKDSCIQLNDAKRALGQRPDRNCDTEFPGVK